MPNFIMPSDGDVVVDDTGATTVFTNSPVAPMEDDIVVDPNAVTNIEFDKGSRKSDFNDNPVLGDIYNNAGPARKLYDTIANEYSALNASVNGNYEEEIFFGDNVRDMYASWDINRTEVLSDKERKFKEFYPEGKVRVVPYDGKEYILAKKDATSPWRKLGSNFADKTVSGTLSLATAGSVAGEMVGSRVLPIAGGPLGAAVGGFFGDVADRAIEQGRGNLQEQSIFTREQIAGAALNAAFSWYGKGGAVVPAGKKIFENSPSTRVLTAAEFAEQEGLPNITRGEAASNPILQMWYKQAQALDAETKAKGIETNIKAVDRYLQFITDSTGNAGLDQNVLKSVLGAARYNLEAIISGMRSKEIPTEKGMKYLKEAFENWDGAVGGKNGAIDQAFDEVLALSDDVSFDISSARRKVDELIDGVQGAGEKEVAVPASTMLGPDGKPLVPASTGTEEVPVKISLTPQGQLKKLMEGVKALKGDIVTAYTNPSTGNEFGAYQQVKRLITDFGKLTESEDPATAGIAKQVYAELKKSLDTATIDKSGLPPEVAEEFTTKWTKARKMYKDYLELRDQKVISKLDDMDMADYQDAGDKLLRPGNSEVLRTVSDIMPEGKKILQGIFYNKLFAGERNKFGWENSVRDYITKFSDAGDKESLDILFNPGEEANVIQYANLRDKLESSVLPKLANSDASASQLAFKVATEGDTDALKNIIEVSGGLVRGKPTKAFQALRAGTLQHIYEESTVNLKDHGAVFVYQKFKNQLDNLANNGSLKKLFSDNEIEWLRNFDNYVDVVQISPNMGAGLQAAAVAAGIPKAAERAGEKIAAGNVEGGIGTFAKAFVLPISYRFGGRFFLNGAQEFNRAAIQPTGKTIAKQAALDVARKAMVSVATQEKDIIDSRKQEEIKFVPKIVRVPRAPGEKKRESFFNMY